MSGRSALIADRELYERLSMVDSQLLMIMRHRMNGTLATVGHAAHGPRPAPIKLRRRAPIGAGPRPGTTVTGGRIGPMGSVRRMVSSTHSLTPIGALRYPIMPAKPRKTRRRI